MGGCRFSRPIWFFFFLRKKEVQQQCELALFVVTPTRLFLPSIVCARIQSSVNKGARREYFLLLLVVVASCHAAAAAHSGDSDGSAVFFPVDITHSKGMFDHLF